jgi:hypothetical protein
MAIEKKVELGAINITVHPHSINDYIELFQKASKAGAIKVRGTTYCELRHVEVDEKEGLVYAEIYKYTDIDKNAPWYNTKTLKLATDTEVENINIPEDYKPNAGKFSLYLYPKKHIIFYQSYYKNSNFSSTMAVAFFENLFAKPSLIKHFGIVNVTHIPEKQKVSEIIDYANKESLTLNFSRPNPDSLADVERQLLEQMNHRNVKEYNQQFKAIDEQSLVFDEPLKTMTKIASKNGFASIKVKLPNGAKKIISTKDHPFSFTEYYDPQEINETAKFKVVVLALIDRITDWLS